MNCEREEAVCNLVSTYGFTDRQAEFLYLAGTGAGLFTAAQYAQFAGIKPGAAQSGFIKRLNDHGLILTAREGRLHVFRLNNRKFYDAIFCYQSLLSKAVSRDLVEERLQFMDYLATHPELEYQGSDEAKRDFFDSSFGPNTVQIPTSTRTNKLLGGARVFPDPFPIFAIWTGEHVTAGIVWGEPPSSKPVALRTFLKQNLSFLSTIPRLHFVYVSPHSRCREAAEKTIREVLFGAVGTLPVELKRYFALRQKIDNNEANSFTREDYEHWKPARKAYAGEQFEKIYQVYRTSPEAAAALFNTQSRCLSVELFDPTNPFSKECRGERRRSEMFQRHRSPWTPIPGV